MSLHALEPALSLSNGVIFFLKKVTTNLKLDNKANIKHLLPILRLRLPTGRQAQDDESLRF